MLINKIENTNFKGQYKLANTPANYAKLTKFIIPAYLERTDQKIIFFSGNNPFKMVIKKIIDDIAKENNSSVEWVKMNANRHGLYMNDDGNETLNIITSDKDTKAFYDYMSSRIERLKPSFKNMIKRALGMDNMTPHIDKNLPQHMILLSYSLNFDKEETEAFKEYSKDFKSAPNADHLFDLIMRE